MQAASPSRCSTRAAARRFGGREPSATRRPTRQRRSGCSPRRRRSRSGPARSRISRSTRRAECASRSCRTAPDRSRPIRLRSTRTAAVIVRPCRSIRAFGDADGDASARDRRGRRHHRHVHAGDHAHRCGADARRPRGRRHRDHDRREPAASGLRARTPEDRHAAAAASRTRSISPRCRAQHGDAEPDAVLRSLAGRAAGLAIPSPAADRLLGDRDDLRDARADPGEPASRADVLGADRSRERAALLPVDRGQGRALRRSRAAPRLPRARDAAWRPRLLQRHQRPRCPRRSRWNSSARWPAALEQKSCDRATRSSTTWSGRIRSTRPR